MRTLPKMTDRKRQRTKNKTITKRLWVLRKGKVEWISTVDKTLPRNSRVSHEVIVSRGNKEEIFDVESNKDAQETVKWKIRDLQ